MNQRADVSHGVPATRRSRVHEALMSVGPDRIEQQTGNGPAPAAARLIGERATC